MEKAEFPERCNAFAVDVEYASNASESVVRRSGDAGVVVTYHDGITVEKPGAESRRKILACVHVEENSRREEYGALPGALSEEAANSSLPAGALQRRSEPELLLSGPQNGRDGDRNADNRVCGEKLPQVYRALGMDKPEAVAKVCYAQMVKQFLSRDPFECVLCGGRMVYRRAIAGLNVDGLKKNARDISLQRYIPA